MQMKIEFGLMSVVSLIYLLCFSFSGDVELLSIDASFSIAHDESSISVNPVWIVWVPEERIPNCNAFAYGNVIVAGEWARGNIYGDYLIAHEYIHVLQLRALGFLAFPSKFLINIEPDKNIAQNWNDLSQPARTMWLPQANFIDQWSFMRLHSTRTERLCH